MMAERELKFHTIETFILGSTINEAIAELERLAREVKANGIADSDTEVRYEDYEGVVIEYVSPETDEEFNKRIEAENKFVEARKKELLRQFEILGLEVEVKNG